MGLQEFQGAADGSAKSGDGTATDGDGSMISHADLVTMYVEDQDRMVAFFTGKLGFDKRTDAEMGPGRRWIEVIPSGAQTGLALLKAADFNREPDTGYDVIYSCSDLQAAGERLKQNGVEVTDIVTEFWGSYRLITDPEGRDLMISAPTIGR
jgi:lactoylglutathione lyase